MISTCKPPTFNLLLVSRLDLARTHGSQHHHLQHAAKHSGEMLGDPENFWRIEKNQHPPLVQARGTSFPSTRIIKKCLERTWKPIILWNCCDFFNFFCRSNFNKKQQLPTWTMNRSLKDKWVPQHLSTKKRVFPNHYDSGSQWQKALQLFNSFPPTVAVP